eukprot:TRINITY_DN1140_c0_g1_i1.p2 TRINITY_DN1140_c0_g1~~TRINITY_DN1140_c0_g1_i1.p2  ORF type:complete len:207 (+),score=66.51 TRINITY_DN1140_c0_g1_i1:90-623(+)
MGKGEGPSDQAMGRVGEQREKVLSKFPTFQDMTQASFRRSACLCLNCSCCHQPKDEDGVRQMFSCGRYHQCICCTQVATYTCCACKPEWKAYYSGDCLCGQCDFRPSDGCECCYCIMEAIQCCCIQGIFGGFCNHKKITLCKHKQWCCCLYQGCAIPCDEDNPMEVGICGIMIINKA